MSLIEGWEKKRFIYSMNYYSAIKKNDILSVTIKWSQVENIIFSEIGQI